MRARGRSRCDLARAAGVEPRAVRDGILTRSPEEALVEAALDQGVIDEGESRVLKEWEEIRTDVIQVDVFEAEEYRSLKG